MTENCIKLNGERNNKLFLFNVFLFNVYILNVLKDGDSEIDSAFTHKNFLWTKAEIIENKKMNLNKSVLLIDSFN